MSRLALHHVTADGVAPFQAGLAALERDILYPIADGADHFYIDHGPLYHPFFSRLGEAHFLIAAEGEDVVGNLVAVRRPASIGARRLQTFYMCDYKISRAHRGGALARKMALMCIARLAVDRRLWDWSLTYGAAMRGRSGDVSRSFAQRLHPGRLFAPAASLRVYFEPAERLANLDLEHAPAPPSLDGVLDLSLAEDNPDVLPPGTQSTAGRKDLRLISSGAPWPLTHLPLGPKSWTPTHGHYLARCGAALTSGSGAPPTCCFAIDDRLKEHVRWLSGQGVATDTFCTIYALALPSLIRQARWVHLATSEI